jgi:hypothetical protein
LASQTAPSQPRERAVERRLKGSEGLGHNHSGRSPLSEPGKPRRSDR